MYLHNCQGKDKMKNEKLHTIWKLGDHFWDKDYYWLRQVIQNSIHLGIPLRIYDLEKAKQLNRLFEKYFPRKDFDKYLTDIITDIDKAGSINGIKRLREDQNTWSKLFKEFKSHTPWVTSISFPHPFWDTFVKLLKEPQRWWIELYCYYHLVKNRDTQKELEIKPLFTENIGRHLKWGYITLDNSYLIVSSFIWELPEKKNDAFLVRQVAEIAFCLKNAFNLKQEVSFAGKVKLMEPIFEEIFEKHLKQTKKIFQLLLNTEIEFSLECFRRIFCTVLARTAVFVHHPTIRKLIKDILSNSRDKEVKKWKIFKKYTHKEKITLFYKIDFSPPFSKEDDSRQKQKTQEYLKQKNYFDMFLPPAYIELSLDDENRLKMRLRRKNTVKGLNINNFKKHYWVYQNGQDKELHQELELEWSHFLSKIKTKARLFEQQVLQFTMEQLRNHWGNIALPEPVTVVKKISDEVIKEITHLFTGDYGILCVYKPQLKTKDNHILKDVLFPLGIYVNPFPYSPNEHRKIKEGLEDFILHIEEKDKEKSIIYRALFKKEKQFTRFYDTEEAISLPSGQPLLIPKDLFKKRFVTAMAVPLDIAGIPFGCLEIGGFHPFQFRWANLKHLTRLSEIITSFLFQERFLRGLEEMTSAVLGKEELSDKFKKICEGLTDVFLCSGASLWWRDEKVEGKFICQGAYNCLGLERRIEKGVNPYFIEREKSPLANIIKEINPDLTWRSYDLSKQPDLQKEIKLPRVVKCIIILPIWEYDQKVQGIAILYSKEKYNEEEWQSIAQFTSRYLALLLDAMEGRKRWYRALYSLAMHQIKHYVSALYDRAKSIKKICEENVLPFDDETKSRLRLLGKGIEYSHNDAEKVIRMFAIGAEEETAISYEGLLAEVEPELAIPYKIRQEALKEKPNLKEILEMVISTKWHFKQKKGISIKKDTIPNDVFLKIHRYNLELILENLLDNAIKFAFEGTDIVINWEEKEYVCHLSFCNQGRCLKKGEEFYLFEKGFQGSNAQPEDEEGTKGLGLFVVKHICSFYGIGIKNIHEKLIGNKCLHTFILDIPKRLVIKKENQDGQ